MRVAVDLLGGDRGPTAVIDGALLVLAEQPDVTVTLVGPTDVARALLAQRAAGLSDPRLDITAASEVVEMDEDPARAVRTKRDATVRVAARLVRDGAADAFVSVGSTGAAMAAALFTLGRLPGVSRPALAAVVPAARGPVVFLDVGANVEATPAMLAQFAVAGTAYAQVRLGLSRPRVGLLSNGEEPGKGDPLRKAAYAECEAALSRLAADFVGNVEGSDVPYGGTADVVVTDGFTGNVLAKGLEGALRMLGEVLLAAFTSTPERRAAASELMPAMAEATGHMHPDQLGGAMLLGVDGVAVVGHGSSTPRAVASSVAVAAQAAREALVPRLAAALGELGAAAGSGRQVSVPVAGGCATGRAAT